MKKVLSAAVLALALLATIGSSEEDSGSNESTNTTAGSGAESSDAPTTAGSGQEEPGQTDEVDDVKITACAKDDTLGVAKATIEVTNNSSKASSYAIELAFETKDGATQIGTGSSFINSLNAGQKKTEEVTSFEEPGDQEFNCRVVSVERLAA